MITIVNNPDGTKTVTDTRTGVSRTITMKVDPAAAAHNAAAIEATHKHWNAAMAADTEEESDEDRDAS